MVKADGCLIGRVTKHEPHGDVTYAKQIARIIQNRCVECHRPGEIAPFAMTSYDEVRRLGRNDPRSRRGRPHAPLVCRPQFGHFSNDARLSDDEKQQIAHLGRKRLPARGRQRPARAANSPKAGRWANRTRSST